jgi:hypothetical protein
MNNTLNPITPAEPEYISITDAAKLIRAQLAKKFPGVKFSVTTTKYSGGGHVNVKYTDGPNYSEVEKVVAPYGGTGFDGMIDGTYCNYSWLAPDGSAAWAYTAGTSGSVPEWMGDPHAAGCRYVRFSGYSPSVSRTVSDALYWSKIIQFEQETGFTVRHRWAEWKGEVEIYRIHAFHSYIDGEERTPRRILEENYGMVFDGPDFPIMHPKEMELRTR